MSLPDTPNTLREKYYSVMAGQNDADILPDIETAPSTENRYLDYIARNGGGGGGDVTKAYVDEQDAKKVDKVSNATANNFAALDASGNLTDSGKSAADFATASDVEKANITDKASSSALSITDSADARMQDLRIYGRTESGHSVGESGLTVTSCGKNLFYNNDVQTVVNLKGLTITRVLGESTINVNNTITQQSNTKLTTIILPAGTYVFTYWGANSSETCYANGGNLFAGIHTNTPHKFTLAETTTVNINIVFMADTTYDNQEITFQVEKSNSGTAYEPYTASTVTITTALPLRSNGDVKDEIDFADGQAITRIDSNGDVLATPVITPLSATEITAFRALRTFDSVTNITATDDPDMSVTYIKNTANGEAVGAIEDDLQGQITVLNTAKQPKTLDTPITIGGTARTTVETALGALNTAKVDAETGKGLSTEDYTTAEKTKLSGIAAGATANTVISTTVTLAANAWVGNAAPYTQTVNVTGILATDEPVLDVSVSDTVATGLDEIEQFGYISKAVTGAGTITFSCYEDKPDIALMVKIKVVR